MLETAGFEAFSKTFPFLGFYVHIHGKYRTNKQVAIISWFGGEGLMLREMSGILADISSYHPLCHVSRQEADLEDRTEFFPCPLCLSCRKGSFLSQRFAFFLLLTLL